MERACVVVVLLLSLLGASASCTRRSLGFGEELARADLASVELAIADLAIPDLALDTPCPVDPESAIGQPCAPEERECIFGMPAPCMFGNGVRCSGGSWMRIEAPPFPDPECATLGCGSSTCGPGLVCVHSIDDASMSESLACAPLPAPCATREGLCACLMGNPTARIALCGQGEPECENPAGQLDCVR